MQVTNDGKRITNDSIDEFDTRAKNMLGRVKTTASAKASKVKRFMRTYDAGMVGNGAGLVATTIFPGSFGFASIVIGMAVEIAKGGRCALTKENLDRAITSGALKTMGSRVALCGAFGFAVMTAGCVSEADVTYIGQNTIDPDTQFLGGNISVGPNVVIGDNVVIQGDNITLENTTLIGQPDIVEMHPYYSGKSVYYQTVVYDEGITIKGNDVRFSDSIVLSGSNDHSPAWTYFYNRYPFIACGPTGEVEIFGNSNTFQGSGVYAGSSIDGSGNLFDKSVVSDTNVLGGNEIINTTCDNADVKAGTRIFNSRLGDSSSVASGCELDNVIVGHGAEVQQNSVLLNGVIGHDSCVEAGSIADGFNVPDSSLSQKLGRAVGSFVNSLTGGPS